MKHKCLALLFLVFPALAQTSTPDCQFTFTATASGAQSPAVTNLFTNASQPATRAGCTAWTFKYATDNANAVSIQLEGAADAVTLGHHAPTGSYTALTVSSASGSGSNPETVTTSGGAVLCCDYYPWIRLHVNTLTAASGTPSITVLVYGYKTNSALQGGGGSGGITALTQDVTASGSGSVPATVVGIDTVPLCMGFTPTEGQTLLYTTTLSPNPCYTAVSPASTVSAISVAGTYSTDNLGNDYSNIKVNGTVGYVLNHASSGDEGVYPALSIYNLVNPALPVLLGSYTNAHTGYNGGALAVSGTEVYAVQGFTGGADPEFVIYDASNPASITVAGTLTDLTNLQNATGVALNGTVAYVVNSFYSGAFPSFTTVNVSNPSAPAVLGSYTDATNGYGGIVVAVSGTTAYELNYLFGGDSATHPALVILDVTNPASPALLGTYTNATNGYESFSIAVQGKYAYVVNNLNSGDESTHPALVIYDVSNPASPSVVGTYTSALNGYNAVCIQVSGNRAYVTNSLNTGGFTGDSANYPVLVVYDISNPAAPTVVATFTNEILGFDASSIAVSGEYGFQVNAQAGTSSYPALVSYSLALQPSLDSKLTIFGNHLPLNFGTPTPTLSSCGSPGAAIIGTDIAGRVKGGTGATGCIVTFNATYSVPPACVVTFETGVAGTYSAVYNASFNNYPTLNVTAATLGTGHFDYICFGR